MRLTNRGVYLSFQVYEPLQDFPPKFESNDLGVKLTVMNMKNLLPRQERNFFTREHGLCFAGYYRSAQPEGWRFGTPTAPKESKPRPSRRSDRGFEGLLLGTPPSGRSPKAREDKTSGAMKPMSRASAEMARLVGPRVGRRRQAKTGRHKRPDEEWSVGPHDLRRSGRRGPSGVVGLSELNRT